MSSLILEVDGCSLAFPELDRTMFNLQPDEEAFLKSKTGIADAEELKQFIFTFQEEAYKVFPFPCIRAFSFVGFKAARLPIYEHVLDLGRERSDVIYLDVGCGVGNDIRKVIDDGFPADRVVATDILQDFWDIGHKLFKSTPESFPVRFISGDIFDPSHLALVEHDTSSVVSPPPSLESLTSLNPLRGHVSVIYAASFFHLFCEDRQLELARLFAGLLSPRPGSTIFGSHVGLPKKGSRGSAIRYNLFGHSPESWTEMWEEVFGKGVVQVNAHMREVRRDWVEKNTKSHILIWSIVRL